MYLREEHYKVFHYLSIIKGKKYFKNCAECFKKKIKQRKNFYSVPYNICEVPLCPLCFKDYRASKSVIDKYILVYLDIKT